MLRFFMYLPRKSGWLGLWMVVWPVFAQASGLDALAQFVKSVRSARAEFTQTVTPPKRADQAVARSKISSGQFAFVRPGRFRFDYQKPFAQTIVADGQTLWFYDPDLQQATARIQSQVLGNTPAALVASAAEMSALERDFQLLEAPDADGLSWVLATPRQGDSGLQSVRVGLRIVGGGGVQLARLDILDGLGQRSVIVFERFESNPTGLGGAQFQFSPPKGVDVIRP